MLTIKMKARTVKYKLDAIPAKHDDFIKMRIDVLKHMLDFVDDEDFVMVDQDLFIFLKF